MSDVAAIGVFWRSAADDRRVRLDRVRLECLKGQQGSIDTISIRFTSDAGPRSLHVADWDEE